MPALSERHLDIGVVGMSYLATSRNFYADNLQHRFGTPEGCEPAEIARLEARLGSVLPDAYKDYLEWIGDFHDGPFAGSEWFLRNVIDNTNDLADFLSENDQTLGSCVRPLCFFSHQGYMAAWFDLMLANPDPTCYFYSEGDGQSVRNEGRFSDFLFHELQGIRGAA